MKTTAWALGASMTLLGLLALPAPASAHHLDLGRGVYETTAPLRILLPWDRVDIYGGDVTLFFEAGHWWCFVDDRLYRAELHRGDWLLVRAYSIPRVSAVWTRPLQRACYRGDTWACRRWQGRIHRRLRHRGRYWRRQRVAWNHVEYGRRSYVGAPRHRGDRWGIQGPARGRQAGWRRSQREHQRQAREHDRDVRRQRRQERREEHNEDHRERSHRDHDEGRRFARR